MLAGSSESNIFRLAANTFVMDATINDRVDWGNWRLTGGVQQSWMEGGWAYWSPFTSLIGSGGIGTAVFAGSIELVGMFAADVGFMSTVRYAVAKNNQLVVEFARGRAGEALIQNYDAGLGAGQHAIAGITVFKQGSVPAGKQSVANFIQYIDLALRAGFGVSFPGTDPLILDLAGKGLALTDAGTGAYFDIDHTGFAKKTAWTGAGNAFLARDINGNGKIDDISEMFGNATQGRVALNSPSHARMERQTAWE